MGTEQEMRPITFKGGRDCGKVIGIRGLYRDLSGRWYVRKSINGIDKQKTVDFGGKNPTFSLAERLAQSALRALEKEIQPEAEIRAIETKKEAPSTAIERGQAACEKWVKTIYAGENEQKSEVVKRRRIAESKGFAFVTNELAKSEEQINDHNTLLLAKIVSEKQEAGHYVNALDFYKHIKAIFSKAIQAGKHKGSNPTANVSKPADMSEKDDRWISIEESAKVQAYLPLWAKERNMEASKMGQVALFHYLLTLGMRPSSAILFKSEDLKQDNRDYYWRYRVINAKTKRKMPTTQIIHPVFARALKKMGQFSLGEKTLLDATNQLIKDVLKQDVSAKHLRKGFLTEIQASGEFSATDARRLTHKTNDVVENHYYGLSQKSADAVSEWWNQKWYDVFERALSDLKWKDVKPSYFAQFSIELMKKTSNSVDYDKPSGSDSSSGLLVADPIRD